MSETSEVWLPVVGFEGFYEVSNEGRVRSLDKSFVRKDGKPYNRKGQQIAVTVDGSGHAQVIMYRSGQGSRQMLHQVVLRVFVGEPPAGTESCHGDGNALNNNLVNLRWDTHSANMLDKVKHGTHHEAAKTHCKRGHEFSEENTRRRNGRRLCLTCYRARRVRA